MSADVYKPILNEATTGPARLRQIASDMQLLDALNRGLKTRGYVVGQLSNDGSPRGNVYAAPAVSVMDQS